MPLRGRSRIIRETLSTLSGQVHIAKVLDVPVGFFFDDMGEEGSRTTTDDTLTRRESLELLRRYYSLPEETRRGIYALVKTAAGAASDEE